MRTELLALLAFAGCKCGSESTNGIQASSPATGDKAAAPSGPPLASKAYFRVDAAPDQPACQVDAPCEAQLILTALGDYHVNNDYPFKLVAEATPNVKVDGTGTFSPKGKQGTMALPFRTSSAGTVKIAGTFKLSVCNDENCQIESPKIAFEIPVRAAAR
mgnify:CR=1 FL=1